MGRSDNLHNLSTSLVMVSIYFAIMLTFGPLKKVNFIKVHLKFKNSRKAILTRGVFAFSGSYFMLQPQIIPG